MIQPLTLAASIPLMHRVVPLALAFVVLGVTVEMIRRRKLREEYAMLWLGTSIVLVIIAAFPQITFWVSRTFNINYVTVMILAVFVFLTLILLQYATVISRHAEHIRQLTEQIALLKEQLRRTHANDDPEGPVEQAADDDEKTKVDRTTP
ncbi:MAG: DUF2304 domain-containing protein [Phycisphaerae bacterium]|jgi:hypothetical protein|nr:DUF2304 domain-containing protein [Phycisphaerae bacterium]